MKTLIAIACLLAGPLGPADPSPTASSPGLAPAELELWTTPEFQRQFTLSYLAETDIEPSVSRSEREQMQEIMELMSANDIEGAMRELERRRDAKSTAVFDFTLANIYFQREQLEQAAEAYRVAVDKFPKFRRAWRNLGVIRVRQGEFENAIPALTRVIELGGADAITYGLLAYSYASVDRQVAAESAYRLAMLLDPEEMQWKMGLARTLFKQELYPEAAAMCRSLIADEPERADLWLLQANAFVGMNQPLRAAENYELVDQLGASTPDSLNMLGDIYVNEELFDLAVATYARALDMNPEVPTRALRAASVLAARGALDDARTLVEHIEDGVGDDLLPDTRKELLKLRARIAVAVGAGDEEARVLEEIVEIDPLDGEAIILLGQHADRSGDIDKAIFHFERAASIPDHEADAKVRHAQLLVRNGRYAEALPLLRRAQTLNFRENVQDYLEHVERVAGK